jgi:hypothetical protein
VDLIRNSNSQAALGKPLVMLPPGPDAVCFITRMCVCIYTYRYWQPGSSLSRVCVGVLKKRVALFAFCYLLAICLFYLLVVCHSRSTHARKNNKCNINTLHRPCACVGVWGSCVGSSFPITCNLFSEYRNEAIIFLRFRKL